MPDNAGDNLTHLLKLGDTFLFKGISESLTRTRRSVFGQFVNVLGTGEINEETWEDLEAIMIQADMGVETTMTLIDRMRKRADREGLHTTEGLISAMKEEMRGLIAEPPVFSLEEPRQLTVVMIVGVNGSGKTTTIGKLAHLYKGQGKKVMLAAGDTFRAAAIDQLTIWSERAGVPIVAGQPGGDPASVAYDGIRASRARNRDLLFIDTAGRLHTKYNLMQELEKTYHVCRKSVHEAPHEVLLVLDAPTGQNALAQAAKFKESVQASGVVLTKLDSTAKGGMIFAIYQELGLPVRFIGTGEGINDLAAFDRDTFVESLFENQK